MKVAQTKTIAFDIADREKIIQFAELMNDIYHILDNDEAIRVYDAYYDKEFTEAMLAFVCDLRAKANNLEKLEVVKK